MCVCGKSSGIKPARKKASSGEKENRVKHAKKSRIKKKLGESSSTAYTVPTKQYVKWQPISAITMKTVNMILDTNIRQVKGQTC